MARATPRPPLVRLTIAETISPLGDAMATIAIILHLQASGGTGTTVAAVMFAEAIPPVLSPIAGTIADRVRDARTLIALAALLQALTLGALALALPSIGLVAIAVLLFVRAAIDSVAQPALNAIVPTVVSPASLPSANSLIAGAREVGTIVGPPLAGLIFAIADARLALYIDAATFIAVIPLIAGLPRPAPSEPHAPARWWTDVVDGLRLVWEHRTLRAIAIGFWLLVFFTAPDDLAIVFLARDDFDATPFEIGLLVSAASVGLVLAAPFIRVVRRRLSSSIAAIVAGGLVLSMGNLLTAVAPALALAFAMQTVRGAGVALFDAAGVRAFIQEEVPPRLMGRAFANIYGGVSVTAALGYVAAGPFLDATSPRVVFAVIGVGGAVATLFMWMLVPRRGPSTTGRPTGAS